MLADPPLCGYFGPPRLAGAADVDALGVIVWAMVEHIASSACLLLEPDQSKNLFSKAYCLCNTGMSIPYLGTLYQEISYGKTNVASR